MNFTMVRLLLLPSSTPVQKTDGFFTFFIWRRHVFGCNSITGHTLTSLIRINSLIHDHTVFVHRLVAKVLENKQTLGYSYFLLLTAHPQFRNVMPSHFT